MNNNINIEQQPHKTGDRAYSIMLILHDVKKISAIVLMIQPSCPCKTCNPIQQLLKLLGQYLALHFLLVALYGRVCTNNLS